MTFIDLSWSPRFRREIKRIAKKYPRVYNDISKLAANLMVGELPGKNIDKVRGLPVKSARIQNSTAKRGKSGGFRVLYHYTDDIITFISIYPRQQAQFISSEKMMSILKVEGVL